MSYGLFAVCGPPQCAATPSVYLVRGITRLPSEEYGATSPGDRSHRHRLPRLLRHVHRGTTFEVRTDPEETVHQVHLPFSFLFHFPL